MTDHDQGPHHAPLPALLEDDPARPWKAVGAAVSALAVTLLGLGLDLPGWAVTVLVVLAAAGGAFVPPNPKRAKYADGRGTRSGLGRRHRA